MRPLIDNGYVYIAQPPLYKVKKQKKEYYVYSDKQLEALLEEIGKSGIELQRYKVLVSGFIVVSHNCSGFISPRPLYLWSSIPLLPISSNKASNCLSE